MPEPKQLTDEEVSAKLREHLTTAIAKGSCTEASMWFDLLERFEARPRRRT